MTALPESSTGVRWAESHAKPPKAHFALATQLIESRPFADVKAWYLALMAGETINGIFELLYSSLNENVVAICFEALYHEQLEDLL